MSLNKIEAGSKLPVFEEIYFTYKKIDGQWVAGNITTSDDWQAVT